MKHFVLMMVCFLQVVLVSAQKDYKPAYIITNDFDTISGFVSTGSDIQNARRCLFRADMNSDPVVYNPADLFGYRIVNDRFFVSKYIQTGEKTEKQFVEYLINGVVSIYLYAAVDGRRYFAQKDTDTMLVELTSEEKKVYINDVSYSKKDKKYIGALTSLMDDTPELQSDIKKVALNNESLIAISRDYHNLVCNGQECITYERQKVYPLIEFGVLTGYNYSDLMEYRIALYNSSFEYIVFDSEYSISNSMMFGAFARVYLPATNNRLFFSYEGLIMKHEYESLYKLSPDYDETSFVISSQHMRHSLSAGYYFFDSRIRFLAETGLYINHSIGTQYTKVGSDDSIENYFPDKAYWGAFAAGGLSLQLKSGYHVDLLGEINLGFSVYDFYHIVEYNVKLSLPLFFLNRE